MFATNHWLFEYAILINNLIFDDVTSTIIWLHYVLHKFIQILFFFLVKGECINRNQEKSYIEGDCLVSRTEICDERWNKKSILFIYEFIYVLLYSNFQYC